MKQLLTIFMVLAVTVTYAQRQEAILEHKPIDSEQAVFIDTKDDEEEPVGVWIHWDDGIPFGLLGTAAEWTSAIRFTPEDIAAFDDFELTRIRVFVGHMPNYAHVVVYQGEDAENLTEVVNQPFDPVAMSWNLVELDAPYLLDETQELWIGVVWGDADGVFPAVRDEVTDHIGKGDMLRFGDGPWMSLTDTYGFQGDWNIQGFIEGDYNVTFNLEMSYADFDPLNDDVYITGSAFGWTEPGTDSTLLLERKTPLEPTEILYEGFEGGEISDGWLNIDGNNDGRSWHVVGKPSFSPQTGNWAARSESWSGTNIPQDNWLITPRMYVPFDDYELSFYVKAQDANHPEEKYSVLVSTAGTDIDNFATVHTETLQNAEWKKVTIGLGDYEGERINIAFRHYDSEGLSILLDNILVEGTPALMYQVAIENMDLGPHQYKYFLVKDDTPSWEHGEWDGDPNRGIIVTGAMSVHDMWAEQVVHELVFNVVDEGGNPLSDVEFIFEGDVVEETGTGVFTVEAIKGIYNFSASLDGYEMFADEIEVTHDVEETIVLPLYRTVTFEVFNEDEEAIDDAVITFAGITNAAGNYEFENIVADTYNLVVSAPGYMTISEEYTVTDDVDQVDITVTIVMEDAFYITFNLDMAGATFDYFGTEVAFDPSFHKVYISGPEMPIPGSNNNYRLYHDAGTTFTQTIPFAEGDYDYKYYIVIYGETWDHPEWAGDPYRPLVVGPDYGDYTVNDIWNDYEEVPDPVTEIDESFEDGWPEYWQNIDYNGDGYKWWIGCYEDEGVAFDGLCALFSESWDGSPLEPDNWLITPQIDVAGDDFEVTFAVRTIDTSWPAEHYSVMVSTGEPLVPGVFDEIYSETLTADDGDWKEVSLDLSDYAGELIYIAFRHWNSVDWYMISLDHVRVTGTVSVGEVDEMLSARVFPNPASDVMNIQSENIIKTIQVFDVTGRVVHNENIDNNSTVINVSNFNHGVYILRVHTDKGIEHHKFQVTR